MSRKSYNLDEFAAISLREKIAYFVGECGSCGMFYYLTITLSTYFFTDVMHISAITLGTIIIVSRIFDRVSDLIIGSLVDRTHTRWGKARPWVFLSTFPYALAMVLLYCLPASWTTAHQIAYVIITYNLAVTVCYTVANIPWGSLPALMTRDKVQRSQMHSIRIDMTILGAFQVDAEGSIANWTVPGQITVGMGGAMDLAVGAKTVVAALEHCVLHVTEDGLVLEETAPGVTVEDIIAHTDAKLLIPDTVKCME